MTLSSSSKVVVSKADLSQVVPTLGLCCCRAHLLNRWNQQPNQNRDHPNHHQQLNQSEAPSRSWVQFHGCSPKKFLVNSLAVLTHQAFSNNLESQGLKAPDFPRLARHCTHVYVLTLQQVTQNSAARFRQDAARGCTPTPFVERLAMTGLESHNDTTN